MALIAPLGSRPRSSEFDQRLLAAYLWWKNNPESGWFFESKQPGAIYAGYERGRNSLQAKVVYDESSVRVLIAGSRNLNQSESRIHKIALVWLDDLDEKLRHSIDETVRLTRGGGTGTEADPNSSANEQPTLFEASLQELTRNRGEEITPLLSAVCDAARANGPNSDEFISLKQALPGMMLTPSQLVDPVAGVFPDYVDVELGDWFAPPRQHP